MSYDAEVLADAPLSYLTLGDAPGTAAPADLGNAGVPYTYTPDALLGQAPIVLGATASAANSGQSAHSIVNEGYAPSTALGYAGFTWEFWADFGPADQLTIAALFNGQDLNTNNYVACNYIVSNDDESGPGRTLIRSFGNADTQPTPAPLELGPHHYVVSFDGSTANFFYDGELVDTTSVNGYTQGNFGLYPSSNMVFGGYEGAPLAPTPDCLFSHFAAYGIALPAERVAAHYAAGAGGGQAPAPPELAHPRGSTDVRVTVATARASGRTNIIFPTRAAAAAAGRTHALAHATATLQAGTTSRATQGLVLTMATPAIVDGRPTLPAHWARFGSSFRATEGSRHIHAIADPNPVWDPLKGGWGANPPPSSPGRTTPWDARWSVNDLPHPGNYQAGYYWLGAPSGADGTSGIQANARLWRPDPSTPHAPAWHSAYPYKPSVTAHDHYLQGGGVVHHPKGVNFNSHFIEHMWTTFPQQFAQPYTWLIAGIVASWPSSAYVHTILDTGVDPRTRGMHLGADDVERARKINEGTTTRAYMRLARHEIQLAAHTGNSGGPVTRARVNTHLRPCMFVGIFNGPHSYAGVYAPGEKRLTRGKVTGASPLHYLLGRQHGYLDQRRASHLVLFELRFFRRALTRAELDAQYDQLASSHQFHKYRRL